MRLVAFLIAFLTIAATVVVVGEVVGRRSVEPAPVDRIAYADRDGRVWTTSADGTAPSHVGSGHGFFTWPTWSPDGWRIALSGVATDLDGERRAVLLDLDIGTGEANQLHLGEPGVTRARGDGRSPLRVLVARRRTHRPHRGHRWRS